MSYPPIHGELFVNMSLYISLGMLSSPNCTSSVCFGTYLYTTRGGGHFKSDFNHDIPIMTKPVTNIKIITISITIYSITYQENYFSQHRKLLWTLTLLTLTDILQVLV